MGRGGSLAATRPSSHRLLFTVQVVLPMSASMAKIISLGKLFPWPRPRRCPRCGGTRVWGHGYVLRYFDDYAGAVWMKRWRCPECGAVHTCRPSAYWRRFIAPVKSIIASLSAKLSLHHWPAGPSRQRQQYWHRGYLIQSRVDGLPPATIAELVDRNIIIATHSTADRTTELMPYPPYRRLASTAPP